MAEVLTLRRFARRSGLPLGWLKAQVQAGRIPHLRAGRRVLLNPVAATEALARLASQFPIPAGGANAR